ncbi:unnamed protein product [Parajaminaea phylloscopi]
MTVVANNARPRGVSPAFRDAFNHMNRDHKQHLSEIVSHHLGLPRPPTRVRLSGLDERGFEVEYEQQQSFWAKPVKKGVYIKWEGGAKTVSNGKETRPLFVKLSEESKKSQARKPASVIYSVPPELPLFLVGYLFLHYLSTTHPLTRLPSATLTNVYIYLRKALRLERSIPFLLQTLFAVHAVEAVAMFIFVWHKRKGSLSQALLWSSTTVPVGFPTLFRFREINKQWQS